MKDGDRDDVAGTASLSPVAIRAVGEIPLGRGASLMLSGRRSYLDLLFSPRVQATSSALFLDEGEPEASAGETYRQLAREMIAAEREQFVRLRDDGRLSNEAFRRVQRELDLEESALLRG